MKVTLNLFIRGKLGMEKTPRGSGNDRRAESDRRSDSDRRSEQVKKLQGERRLGDDRRGILERRRDG